MQPTDKSSLAGPIAGGVAGGVVVIGAIIAALVIWRRRRQARARDYLVPDSPTLTIIDDMASVDPFVAPPTTVQSSKGRSGYASYTRQQLTSRVEYGSTQSASNYSDVQREGDEGGPHGEDVGAGHADPELPALVSRLYKLLHGRPEELPPRYEN